MITFIQIMFFIGICIVAFIAYKRITFNAEIDLTNIKKDKTLH